MVKEENKRVMITCTPKMLQQLDMLCEIYDMSISQLLKMIVAEKAAERRMD